MSSISGTIFPESTKWFLTGAETQKWLGSQSGRGKILVREDAVYVTGKSVQLDVVLSEEQKRDHKSGEEGKKCFVHWLRRLDLILGYV